MPQWRGILKYIDEGRRVQIVKFEEGGIDSRIVEATRLYATEAIPRLEEDLTYRYHKGSVPNRPTWGCPV
jgi:hypothetical protein